MKLIVVRHGESEENSQKILQGLLPGILNTTGKAQVQQIGPQLSKEKIDVVYCSPINRCQQTLEIIIPFLSSDIPTYTSALIQERDFGQLSGKKHSEVNFSSLDFDTPENQQLGVESLDHLQNRIKQFLNDIKQKHPHQTVLVVTHSNPIRMIFAEILNKTYTEILQNYKIPNASVNIFEI